MRLFHTGKAFQGKVPQQGNTDSKERRTAEFATEESGTVTSLRPPALAVLNWHWRISLSLERTTAQINDTITA